MRKDWRQKCKELAWGICREWDKEKDGVMSISKVFAKLKDPNINPDPNKYIVTIPTLKSYLKEGGFEYAPSQQIEMERWGKKGEEEQKLQEELLARCEDSARKLQEQLTTGEKEIDDLIRTLVADFYVYSRELVRQCVKEGNLNLFDKALKNINNAISATVSSRIIENKPSAIMTDNEGISRLLQKHTQEIKEIDKNNKDKDLPIIPIKTMTG